MTRDNRASAAEMLGLSRQGLYAKLRRYGIGDLDGPTARPERRRRPVVAPSSRACESRRCPRALPNRRCQIFMTLFVSSST